MQTVELFCGTKSFSKVAKELGHDTFTIDNEEHHNPDLPADILTVHEVPKSKILWASPPCTGFSVAAIGTHWTGGKGAYIPKTDTAKLGIELVKHTLKLLNKTEWWFIENPRGVMRKMPFMQDLTRHTVTYCQYGDTRMKPTDIWTNATWWKPRPMCKNGMPCHIAAPRGSKTGTQGLKGAIERGVIPPELFYELFEQYERQYKGIVERANRLTKKPKMSFAEVAKRLNKYK